MAKLILFALLLFFSFTGCQKDHCKELSDFLCTCIKDWNQRDQCYRYIDLYDGSFNPSREQDNQCKKSLDKCTCQKVNSSQNSECKFMLVLDQPCTKLLKKQCSCLRKKDEQEECISVGLKNIAAQKDEGKLGPDQKLNCHYKLFSCQCEHLWQKEKTDTNCDVSYADPKDFIM